MFTTSNREEEYVEIFCFKHFSRLWRFDSVTKKGRKKELSFLKESEQYELYAIMDMEQSIPSLSQANRMKRISQQKGLTMDDICSILEEVKPNQREQVKIPMERIQKYFPKDFTPAQQVELIEKLLSGWAKKYLK